VCLVLGALVLLTWGIRTLIVRRVAAQGEADQSPA
jgi:hypothetical protein